MVCCNASTRDVCPVPEAIRVRFLQNNRVRFGVLQILEAKIKSWISCSVGSVTVTVLSLVYCQYYCFCPELKFRLHVRTCFVVMLLHFELKLFGFSFLVK
jgi:hypothetical protein